MRRSPVVIALLACFATRTQAQKAWQTEIGIQGGFARVVLAGSGADPTNAIMVPGFSLGNTAAGVYVIIPWSRKVAVETEVAASQFALAGGVASLIGAGLRGDYAVTKHVYVAAGGTLAYNNGLGNETQLGVQGGLGYRFRLSRTLKGRVEGRTTFLGKADNARPTNVYSVLFGVSTATSGGQTAASVSARPSTRAWRPQIGIAGGYADAHLIGLGSVTSISLPGYGGALGNALGGLNSVLRAVTLPPTMFAIIPLGNKVALEPGLDIQRFEEGGQTDVSGNLSLRFDYAVHGGWYGALGGNLHYIKTSGVSAETRTGMNVGWGYRFPVVAGVSGRVETNYTWFRGITDLGLPPTNVFGLMFGVTMALK